MNRAAIVVPLWNEFSRGSFGYLDKLVKLYDIDFYFINDGSTDETSEALEKYSGLKNVKIINLAINEGKTSAIKKGRAAAVENDTYHLIGYLDGDGAFEISEVERNLRIAEQKILNETYDVFCTSRVALSGHNIERDITRHLVGRVIRTIIDFRHKELPYGTQSGFKIFSSNAQFNAAIKRNFHTKWFVDIELILELRRLNSKLRIWEEPLLSWRDVENSSLTPSSIFLITSEIANILRIKPTKEQ